MKTLMVIRLKFHLISDTSLGDLSKFGGGGVANLFHIYIHKNYVCFNINLSHCIGGGLKSF